MVLCLVIVSALNLVIMMDEMMGHCMDVLMDLYLEYLMGWWMVIPMGDKLALQ